MDKSKIQFWEFARDLALAHVNLNYTQVLRMLSKAIFALTRSLYEILAIVVIWIHLCLSPILFPIYWLIVRRASSRIDKSLEVDDSWGV